MVKAELELEKKRDSLSAYTELLCLHSPDCSLLIFLFP